VEGGVQMRNVCLILTLLLLTLFSSLPMLSTHPISSPSLVIFPSAKIFSLEREEVEEK
jgi:hypothetical protein